MVEALLRAKTAPKSRSRRDHRAAARLAPFRCAQQSHLCKRYYHLTSRKPCLRNISPQTWVGVEKERRSGREIACCGNGSETVAPYARSFQCALCKHDESCSCYPDRLRLLLFNLNSSNLALREAAAVWRDANSAPPSSLVSSRSVRSSYRLPVAARATDLASDRSRKSSFEQTCGLLPTIVCLCLASVGKTNVHKQHSQMPPQVCS